MLGRPGCSEEVRLRPGCEHDDVAGERAAVVERERPGLGVGADDLGGLDLDVACVVEDLLEVEPDVRGSQLRRCHLVEQRLELVVAVLVDDGDADAVLAGEALRAGDAREASADDDDMSGAVLVHRPARNDRRSCVGRHHPEGMNKAALLRYEKTLTARAMTRPSTASEMKDWTVMAIFAHGTSGITSVGLKAVALVYPR